MGSSVLGSEWPQLQETWRRCPEGAWVWGVCCVHSIWGDFAHSFGRGALHCHRMDETFPLFFCWFVGERETAKYLQLACGVMSFFVGRVVNERVVKLWPNMTD